jgi:hypothetical protein
MNEPCYPCIEKKCEDIVPVDCAKKVCNQCEESYRSECVFITDKIMCTGGKLFIQTGTNLNDAIAQLLCEIDRLKERVDFIQQNGNQPTVCEIPQILKINING